jgi:galactose mutarotase-like enzyme
MWDGRRTPVRSIVWPESLCTRYLSRRRQNWKSLKMKLYSSRYHGCRYDEFQWRGHRLCVVENELLRISILLTKGADIIEFRFKPEDIDLLWHAPQAILPPGQAIATVARGQGTFLDHYSGGWQEVCPTAGPATTYFGADMGQHGESALLPWDMDVIEDTASRIVLECSVELLRTPFLLSRRLILESGKAGLRVEGTLTNLGMQELPFAWGHHPCFSAPFLVPGTQIVLPECDVTVPELPAGLRRGYSAGYSGRFPWVRRDDGSHTRVDLIGPMEQETEDLVVLSGFDRDAALCLVPPDRPWHLRMAWDAQVFPWLWSWQVYGGSFGYPYYGRTHSLGLEPFNMPPIAWEEHVRNGATRLDSKQAVHSWVEMSIESGKPRTIPER